ncbi:hypothetical protein JW766_00920 [Candidatus Dojkabacteria bacterium]|nr:hypothetical protein [Candidatus Dojkabacteria bacterium]
MKFLLALQHTLELRILELAKVRELLELILLSAVSFLIPVFIGHPQVFVGIVVNTLIVRSALTMKSWKNLPTILLPSLGALVRGVLFGPFTSYLFFLIPVIWTGNFILTYLVKKLSRRSFLSVAVFSSVCKAAVIFAFTLMLVKVSVIPDLFLKSMGIIQVITALAGTTIALGVTKLELKSALSN